MSCRLGFLAAAVAEEDVEEEDWYSPLALPPPEPNPTGWLPPEELLLCFCGAMAGRKNKGMIPNSS